MTRCKECDQYRAEIVTLKRRIQELKEEIHDCERTARLEIYKAAREAARLREEEHPGF